MRALFIIKRRMLYGGYSPGTGVSTGLINSACFVSDMLNQSGVESKVVQVIDNNCIDREVTAYRPDVVFIEALWVVPEKFEILHQLHPNVTWVIRVHSETPFIAVEGQSIDWLFQHAKQGDLNVVISTNSPRANYELAAALQADCSLLPNYYPIPEFINYTPHKQRDVIDIGCFGAIRPLKNQLMQAIAAMRFADELGVSLRFHINNNRTEDNGDPVLKNIVNLFLNRPEHTLVQHPWMEHAEFMHIVRSMDLGMQVSFTETFNIVTADMVTSGVPVVVSKEIAWVRFDAHVDPTDLRSVVKGLHRVWELREQKGQRFNTYGLSNYDIASKKLWLDFLAAN